MVVVALTSSTLVIDVRVSNTRHDTTRDIATIAAAIAVTTSHCIIIVVVIIAIFAEEWLQSANNSLELLH